MVMAKTGAIPRLAERKEYGYEEQMGVCRQVGVAGLLAVLLLLLSACGHPAPEASGAAAEGLSATDTITPEEGVAILEKQLGAVDEATGNVMSYGYEGPLTLDGVDYYNYRVSWLVDGDHLSYLTNYLVSTDGLVVQEYLPETD